MTLYGSYMYAQNLNDSYANLMILQYSITLYVWYRKLGITHNLSLLSKCIIIYNNYICIWYIVGPTPLSLAVCVTAQGSKSRLYGCMLQYMWICLIDVPGDTKKGESFWQKNLMIFVSVVEPFLKYV